MTMIATPTMRTFSSVLTLSLVLACGDSGSSGGRFDSNDGASAADSGLDSAADTSEASSTGASSGPVLDIGDDPTAEGADTECGSVEVDTSPVTPTVLLLVDQSGSMWYDFGGQPRWQVLQNALFDEATGVIKPLEDDIRFGLALYSSNNGDFGGACPMLTELDPSFGNHAQLASIFAAAQPIDETPTGESLDIVATQLADFPEEGPKIILLATDGDPDTCAVPDPQNGQPESIAAAQNAYELGIRTFVISVGDEVADTHLQELANAGVGLPPQGSESAPFYKALSSDELLAAFEATINGFIGCEFTLDGIVDLDLVCQGEVLLDGEPLICNEDWELVDESTLRILGEACETLGDGEFHTVDASWPCGAVQIP